VGVSSLVEALRSRLLSEMPSLYYLLELLCRREFGRGFVELLLEEPEKSYSLLLRLYGRDGADAILYHYALKPALATLGSSPSVSRLLAEGRYLEALKEVADLARWNTVAVGASQTKPVEDEGKEQEGPYG